MDLAVEFLRFVEAQGDQTTDVLLDRILLKCRELLDAEAGTIFVIEERECDRPRVRPVSVQNDVVDMSRIPLDLEIDASSLAGHVAATGETVLVKDSYRQTCGCSYRFNHEIDLQSGYRTVSVMAFPLKTFSEEVVGVVQLINRRVAGNDEPVPFEPEQAALIEPFNQLVGRAIERTALIEQLRNTNEGLRRQGDLLSEEVAGHERREAALAASESHYRNLFEGVPISIWEEDWSAVKTMADDLAGKGVRDLSPYLVDHPEVLKEMDDRIEVIQVNQATVDLYHAADKEAVIEWDCFANWTREVREAFADQIGDFANGAETHIVEVTETRCDDSPITTRIRATVPREFRGDWSRVLVTVEDVTERTLAEKALRYSADQLRLITDSLPVFIAYVDASERCRFTNKIVEDWWRMPWEETVDKPLSDVVGSAVYELMKPHVAAALSGHPASAEGEATFPNGTRRALGASYVPHFGEGGELLGCIAVIEDITERKRSEALLRQAQKMEAVGQLTGGIAHDFNNLLSIILGNLELVAEKVRDSRDLTRLLASALDATGRGADLTQRLLAFSRRQILQPRPVDLNTLVGGMAHLLRRTLGETIDIETNSPNDLWPCRVDPGQLESALLNLAINARDAMPAGGKLTIETANIYLDDDYSAAQVDVPPGEYVLLSVTDTGQGMPREVVQRVFEPFFTTKEPGKGSGLGLSMVYGFAKQSGGHIGIYSEQGVGTTVKLYLPKTTAKPWKEPATATSREEPRGRGEAILVVEDDPDLRTLVVALLSGLGYDIREASNGTTALSALSETPYVNLLVSDVVLPGGMNGIELAEEARRRVPGIKTLFMSGYTDRALDRGPSPIGGGDLLHKPFRRRDLALKVREALDAMEEA